MSEAREFLRHVQALGLRRVFVPLRLHMLLYGAFDQRVTFSGIERCTFVPRDGDFAGVAFVALFDWPTACAS